jgi:L-iditol 2-dehydrogenase
MAKMMKVGLLAEPHRFIVEERPIPDVGPGEVRIRVAACGICGTDLHAYVGHKPTGWKIVYPFQMGHELSGVIDALGPDIPAYAGLHVGDRVVPDGRMPCRYCHYCRRGQFNMCMNMGYISGGFAQYMVYPYRNLVKVPDGVRLDHAAFGEPLACVVNGNSQLIDVPFAAFGLVMGAGPIGLLHLQMLKMRGLTVAIADMKAHRLQAARALGADHVIDVSQEDLNAEITRLTDGFLADVVISAAGGDEQVIDQAINLAGKRGQIVYFGAVMKSPMTVSIDSIHYKETRLVGSHDSTIAQYETAMKLLGRGAINVEPIISHRYPLEDIWEAFKFAETRAGIKVMIVNEGVE